ncbi:MAG: sulfite exporter TauE/SafE family protein [Candidatus Taylorbacteria bacterium]
MTAQTQKYTFHVHGMHCNACILMTESELADMPNITHVKSSLKNNSVEVIGDFGNKTPKQIAEELTIPLKSHGYTVSVEKQIKEKKWSDFKIAVPIALGFAVLFVVLQKIGIVSWVGGGNVTYGTAFVIGIIASLSTCMAVVGGLLLSMSATFAKEPIRSLDGHQGQRGEKIKPQLMFHGGRIVAFFILGGVIGALGAVFTLSTSATFTLSLIIGIVMLILGINLLDVFPWAKKLQPSMPKFIAKHAHGVSKLSHTRPNGRGFSVGRALTPLLVGIATFFLPCGFTQSMQLYTLTTGSFLKGGFTMLAFALGTLPVLALISVSSFSIKKSSKAGVFFKSAGLIVILFALFNLINSFVVIGLLPPIFNF